MKAKAVAIVLRWIIEVLMVLGAYFGSPWLKNHWSCMGATEILAVAFMVMIVAVGDFITNSDWVIAVLRKKPAKPGQLSA